MDRSEISRFLFDHGESKPADAYQSALFVCNAGLPDLSAPADVQRTCCSIDPARANGFDMIGIYFKSYTIKAFRVYRDIGCHTSKRFGQSGGSTAMEHSKRLNGPVVNRHAGFQKVMPNLEVFNAEMLHHGSAVHLAEFLETYSRVKHSNLQKRA